MANTEHDRIEKEFRSRINDMAQERTKELQKQIEATIAKAAENAAKNRKRRQARAVFHCILAGAFVTGLYLAEVAGMISPVLSGPLNAAAFVTIGWNLCKFDRARGRK